MEMYGLLSVLLVSVVLSGSRAAQTAPPGVRVFALSFMQLDHGQVAFTHLSVTGTESGATRINIPFLNYTKYELLRQSNNYKTEYINQADRFVNHDGGVSDQGIIIITKDTSSVFGSGMIQASGESFLALPLTTKGKHFYIPSYATMTTGETSFAIAAASTNCLEIYEIINGQFKLRNSVHLVKGQIYQEYGNTTGEDFTGLYISSSGPVAVFGGHECAQIPSGTIYCDHLVEQIPAVEFWGKTSVVPPSGGRLDDAGYRVRILASQDTTVTFPYNKDLIGYDTTHGCSCAGKQASTCATPCQISKGGFVEVHVTNSSQPITVACSVPCLVVQYTHSLRTVADEPLDPDPYMMVATPIDHYTNKMSYQTPEYVFKTQNTKVLKPYSNFMTVISLTSDKSGILVDKKAVTGTEVVQGSYTVTTFETTHGYHLIEHSDPLKKIVAFAYGHTPFVTGGTSSSYGTPLGYEIDDVTIPGDWAEQIAIPPGVIDPDVTTAAPTVCARNNAGSTVLTSTFEYRGVDVASNVNACKIILGDALLKNLTDKINQQICDRSLCPRVSDNVAVKQLRNAIVNGTLRVYADLVVDMDAPLDTMIECRVHVTEYIERVDHWMAVLSTADFTTCRNILTSMTKLKHSWPCPTTAF